MASSDIKLKINQKVEIIKSDRSYKCNIQDVTSNAVLIDMVAGEDKKYIFNTGENILFRVYLDREVVKCRSKVLGFKREQSILLAVISLPEVIERIQRREFYRLPITLPVKFAVLPDEADIRFPGEVIRRNKENMEKTISVDLSGGGIRFVSKDKIKYHANVLVNIAIPDDMYLIGTVVRDEVEKELRHHKIALKFLNVQERQRDKLIVYIFNKLREQSTLIK